MAGLGAADFCAFFEAVHRRQPYLWQTRLTEQVLASGRWPDVIDIPTGAGRTGVVDTALFTLAARPGVFARRIVFVVDRRIVIDGAYRRARAVQEALRDARGGVVADVRERLLSLTSAGEPLGVAALRGGVPIDAEWPRRPDQPWLLVCTTEQFGSRLLFRGCGVGARLRPVHAGLAGNDCLVVLDEVHPSRAFLDTLRDASSDGSILSMTSVNRELLPRRFQAVEMSAGPHLSGGSRFELRAGDLESSPRLGRIVGGAKQARLVRVAGARPAFETVPGAVLDIISTQLGSHEMTVGVIVNRVRTARCTYDALRRQGIAAHLLTGRMRPLDAERALAAVGGCLDPDSPTVPGRRIVLVATQAIEVGADFSFDAVITEAAPAASLRQRLGRLDRRGTLAQRRREPARGWIIGVTSALDPKRPDPVYGDAARLTWEALVDLADGDTLDANPTSGALRQLPGSAYGPDVCAPLLLSSHIDAWSQTSPEPVVQPSIGEFLHGKGSRRDPQVSVVWRHDRSRQALALVPPRPAECVSLPLTAVRRWAACRDEVPIADIGWQRHEPADSRDTRRDYRPVRDRQVEDRQVEDRQVRDRQDRQVRDRLAQIVRWAPDGTAAAGALTSPEDIQPGDVLVVDPDAGGLRNGSWDPHRPVAARDDAAGHDRGVCGIADLGDAAQHAHGARLTLRLDDRLLAAVTTLPRPPSGHERETDLSPEQAVRAWLDDAHRNHRGALPAWMSDTIDRLRRDPSFEVCTVHAGSPHAYYILRQRSVEPALLDSAHEPSSTGTAAALGDHLGGVAETAAEFGRLLGLSPGLVDDLRLAGQLHDLGKVDSRFQAQLHGQDPVAVATASQPLAKSAPHMSPVPGRWPPVRHEFTSVALAQSSPAPLAPAHDPDLVLHLVGSHHGFSRPLPAIAEDHDPRRLRVRYGGVTLNVCSDVAQTPLAVEMADRFWRLQRRYGHHGLAWLEAILRLGDLQQSVEEAR